ncbi:ribosomal maturation YjgA family protein [Stakelama tenebrarum]|uniref:DUF2809 domain-containing protein n=1 Tax=Stakelama tenebrarum TaxID=2711215 RepID=A0A6G6Y6L8_9SPHN|nr:DUF2809 domain-containing protein [Sphingosinithalassobacter tenebrarum]QIG80560.1 DUF2809 domain-containing protein [Sphingosinithalassobacter tenebrarum]
MRLRPGYALAALLIFAVEVLIALYVRDAFVRPLLGDVLAVILVYLGLRAILPIGVRAAALSALAIAFAIEFGQLLGLADMLGLARGSPWRVVIGSHYDWRDLIAYTAGTLAALLVERLRATFP